MLLVPHLGYSPLQEIVYSHMRVETFCIEWAERRGVAVTSPRGERGSGIICVAPSRLEESYRALRQARVYCSMREGSLRISPHCYNTTEEMARVAASLDTVL